MLSEKSEYYDKEIKRLQHSCSGIITESTVKELDEGLIRIPDLKDRLTDVSHFFAIPRTFLEDLVDLNSNEITGKNLEKLCDKCRVSTLLFASNNFDVFRDFHSHHYYQKLDRKRISLGSLSNLVTQCIEHLLNNDLLTAFKLTMAAPLGRNDLYYIWKNGIDNVFPLSNEMSKAESGLSFERSFNHLIRVAKLLRLPIYEDINEATIFDNWRDTYQTIIKFPRFPVVSIPNLRKRLDNWLERNLTRKTDLNQLLRFNSRNNLKYYTDNNMMPVHYLALIAASQQVLEREMLIELSTPLDQANSIKIVASDGGPKHSQYQCRHCLEIVHHYTEEPLTIYNQSACPHCFTDFLSLPPTPL